MQANLQLETPLKDDKKSLFQHTQKKAQEIGLTSL